MVGRGNRSFGVFRKIYANNGHLLKKGSTWRIIPFSIVSNPIYTPFRRTGNNPNLKTQDTQEVAVFNLLFPLAMKCLKYTLMYTVSSFNFTQSLPGTVSGRNPAHPFYPIVCVIFNTSQVVSHMSKAINCSILTITDLDLH